MRRNITQTHDFIFNFKLRCLFQHELDRVNQSLNLILLFLIRASLHQLVDFGEESSVYHVLSVNWISQPPEDSQVHFSSELSDFFVVNNKEWVSDRCQTTLDLRQKTMTCSSSHIEDYPVNTRSLIDIGGLLQVSFKDVKGLINNSLAEFLDETAQAC